MAVFIFINMSSHLSLRRLYQTVVQSAAVAGGVYFWAAAAACQHGAEPEPAMVRLLGKTPSEVAGSSVS